MPINYPSRERKLVIKILNDYIASGKGFDKKEFSGINWDAFMQKIPQGLLQIIYEKTIQNPYVPANVKKSLKKRIFSGHKKQLFLVSTLKEVSKKFKEKGIDFILLKGFVIEKIVYHESTRFFDDIDVLVKEGEINNAEKALKELNYEEKKENLPKGHSRKYRHHTIFVKKENSKKENCNLKVELHTSLVEKYSPFNIKPEQFFKASKYMHIADSKSKIKVRVLCNEHLLIHLCLKMIYLDASIFRMQPAYEIAALINNKSINWPKLVTACKSMQASATVYQAIIYSKGLFEIKIPTKALVKLRGDADSKNLMLLKMFSPEKTLTKIFGFRNAKWLFKILLCNSTKKLRLVLEDIYHSYKNIKKPRTAQN